MFLPIAQEDAFSDSLCMLSTVALYHGELSGLNSSSSLGGSPPVQDRLAAMRLASASGEGNSLAFSHLVWPILREGCGGTLGKKPILLCESFRSVSIFPLNF